MLAMGRPADGVKRRTVPRRFEPESVIFQNHYHRLSGEELERAFHTYPFPPGNLLQAENNGQFFYLNRHKGNDCYEEGIRSFRAALVNWQKQ